MDIFDLSYYKINKILHQSLGCWPYQHRTEKYILRISYLILNLSMVIPEIVYLIYVRNDLNAAIDCLPAFIIHFISITKFLTYLINGDKMMELFDSIKHEWMYVTSQEEQDIMHKYAETGRKISLAYILTCGVCLITFLIATFTPRVLDIILPLNESRPLIYIFGAEYRVDPVKYYTPIIIHQSIITTIAVTCIAVTDSTYCIYAHHVCGMFALVSYRLTNMPFFETTKSCSSIDKTNNTKKIVDCIKKHKKPIWFCDMLESSHVGLMFVILLTSVLGLSITGVQAVSNLKQPVEALKSAVLCSAHFMHIFYYSWNCQKILDHSNIIFDAAYNAEWYILLDKTAKLLIFMMLRSTKPCIQTAGTIFPMTLENFTVIVKTSMSYFTVITNFQ